MDVIQLGILSSLVFIVSLSLTYAARYFALRHNLLDHPNQRSSHIIPTPRGGGIAIVLTFCAALIYLWLQEFIATALFLALIISLPIIAILGFYDDLYRMKARTRVSIHFATAAFALYLLDGLPVLDFGTYQFNLQLIGTIIGVISIVWLTNLYNFMDGIDGLSGTEGLFVSISGGLILWFNAPLHQDIALLFFMLAASIAGFTVFNWPPAKIFLGDVGSGFLGFVIAILGIESSKQTSLSISFWIILLAVFICDATFTVIKRALHGKPWYAAHREHAYQRLLALGASHQQITLAIVALNMLVLLPFALLAISWPHYSAWLMMIAVVTLYLLWLIINQKTKGKLA